MPADGTIDPVAVADAGSPVVSVGAMAARLGVAPETLRSWGRRYGLIPSHRSPGGHRRYTDRDAALLFHMQALVSQGHSPSAAAKQARTAPAPPRLEYAPIAGPVRNLSRRPGGPGGRVLAVPGGGPQVKGLARAAVRLDAGAITGILGDLLAQQGSVDTWNRVLRPVLVAVGLYWARTGQGVDIEHILSDAAMESFRAHRTLQPKPVLGRPVLLAAAPDEQHVLPMHVLAAALAERRVLTLMVGGAVPSIALAAAVRRTRASAVFLWSQLDFDAPIDLSLLPRSRPATALVIGGTGWAQATHPPSALHAASLQAALTLLTVAAQE